MNIQQTRERIKTPEALKVFNDMKEIIASEFHFERTPKEQIVIGVDDLAYFTMVIVAKAMQSKV
jgi:hypothetical protein